MKYSIENFERPSVAADVAVFGISTENGNNKRQGKVKKLMLLLVKRGEEPYCGQFALPGGFLRKEETVEQTAERELEEETGVSDVKLISSGIYSNPGRDPRGWIISASFIGLSNTVSLSTKENSDAMQAFWFDFSYSRISTEEIITLTCGEYCEELRFSEGNPVNRSLAFDHSVIIYDAFKKLQEEVLYHDIVFDLLPEMFPVSELQQIYESITGIKEASANFRRKMKEKIEETEYYDERTAHRPSKLYRKK